MVLLCKLIRYLMAKMKWVLLKLRFLRYVYSQEEMNIMVMKSWNEARFRCSRKINAQVSVYMFRHPFYRLDNFVAYFFPDRNQVWIFPPRMYHLFAQFNMQKEGGLDASDPVLHFTFLWDMNDMFWMCFLLQEQPH